MTGEGINVFKEKTVNPQEMRFRKASLHRLLQQNKLLNGGELFLRLFQLCLVADIQLIFQNIAVRIFLN